MLFDRPRVVIRDFEETSGWHIQPEGLCRDDICIPLLSAAHYDGELDLSQVAQALGSPLVEDPGAGLWAIGPRVAIQRIDLQDFVAQLERDLAVQHDLTEAARSGLGR